MSDSGVNTTNQAITNAVAKRFRSFGGGDATPDNPIAAALADRPPCFAACVDISDVVQFVLEQAADMANAEGRANG